MSDEEIKERDEGNPPRPGDPLVKNASDPAQVKGARKRQKKQRAEELIDVKAILSTPHGERFFRRYLEMTNVFATTFCGEQTHSSANAEGMRLVGLTMLHDLAEAAPGKVAAMLKEGARDHG